jgi:DNA-binding XRE family transcriptional regulator
MDELAQLDQQGYSQRRMASALSISRSTIVRWLEQIERSKNQIQEKIPTKTIATFIDPDDIYSLWLRAMQTIRDRNEHA